MGVIPFDGPEAHPPSEDPPNELAALFEKALGIGFDEAIPIVYSTARRLNKHNPDAAQDLAQDVWEHICALIKDGRLDMKVNRPAAWLRRLTTNQWLQKVRYDKTVKRGGNLSIESLDHNREAGNEPASAWTGPEAAAVQNDLENRLHAAAGQLPPHLREVVALTLKGRTHTEIAKTLDISPNTSKTRLRAALELLRGHPGLAAN
jgi:RNA polymerase sigma factor (sigma-70 family)